MNVVAAGSGNVNDTRRRPATVAVAVCIGSYARVIFIDGSKQAKVQAAGPKNDLANKGWKKQLVRPQD